MTTIRRKIQKNKSARRRRNQKLHCHRRLHLKILEKQLHLQEKLDQQKQSPPPPKSLYEQKQIKILIKQLHLQKKLDLQIKSSFQLKSHYEQQQQIYPVQVQPNVSTTNTPTGNIMYYIPTTGGTPIYVSTERPPDPPGFRQPIPTGFGQQGSPGFRPVSPMQEAGGHPDWLEAFTDKKVRRIFIRKVYLILTAQLLFTFGIICLFIFEPHVKHFVLTNSVLLWVALGIYLVVVIALACVEKLRRQFPLNLIMLTLITLCMSYIMGTISCLYETNAVLIAIGICVIVCFAVTVFSFFTKFDLTNCGGIMCILLIVLLIFGIVAIIVRSHTMTMIYAGAGALVFMAFLAYDTQMLMGGKMHAINPEEYVFAALSLYIDIMYIFMYILMLFGGTGTGE